MADAARRKLTLRVVSSLILAAAVGAIVWYGPPAFDVYIIVAAAVLAHEWRRMCGEAGWSIPSLALLLAAVGTVAVAIFIRPHIALVACGAGAIAVYAAGVLCRSGQASWLAIGAVYISLPGLALIGIAHDPEWGRRTLVVSIVAVAATDIGAYFTGRTIGGPKLAPTISPKKTWAGLGGGIICGVLAAAGLGPVLGFPALLGAFLGALLAIISQLGDLFESAMKRRFGVKDSGDIIPGHGGLFDRLDGHIAASCAVAAAHLATGGSVLTWR